MRALPSCSVCIGRWKESEDNLGGPVVSSHVGFGAVNSGGQTWWQAPSTCVTSPSWPGVTTLLLEVLRTRSQGLWCTRWALQSLSHIPTVGKPVSRQEVSVISKLVLKLWYKDGIRNYLLKTDMGGVQKALWQCSPLI